MRPLHLAQQYRNRGYQVTVVTSSLAGKAPLRDARWDLSDITVIHIQTFDSRWISSQLKLCRAAQRDPATKTPTSKIDQRSFIRRSPTIRRLLDTFPFSMIIGEGGPIFFIRGLAIAARVTKPDIIVTSSAPMIDHLLGRIVRRIRGGLWIADFEDPLMDSLSTTTRKQIASNSERRHERIVWRTIGKPDMVTAVSQGVLATVQANSPKLALLPGVSEIPRTGARPSSPFFTIVYTGSLYGAKQDPAPLLVAWRKLLDADVAGAALIRLIYAGPDSHQMKMHMVNARLDQEFIDVGVVSHNEALRLQDEADINLLLTWSTPNSRGVLTGKLFEYLASKRPIICVLTGDNDPEVAGLFRGDPGLVFVHTGDSVDEQALRNTLQHWVTSFAQNAVRPTQIHPNALKHLTWSHQTTPLFDHIANMRKPLL
jgi:hypothetical protein